MHSITMPINNFPENKNQRVIAKVIPKLTHQHHQVWGGFSQFNCLNNEVMSINDPYGLLSNEQKTWVKSAWLPPLSLWADTLSIIKNKGLG